MDKNKANYYKVFHKPKSIKARFNSFNLSASYTLSRYVTNYSVVVNDYKKVMTIIVSFFITLF